MASNYPTSLDSIATNKTDALPATNDHAAHHNLIADAVNKIEATLGNISTLLKGWTMAEAYEPIGTITRNIGGTATSFTVQWPDGSSGIFTTTTIDVSGAINAFTITHVISGKLVTQAAVTRDSSGAVTNKPALVVS